MARRFTGTKFARRKARAGKACLSEANGFLPSTPSFCPPERSSLRASAPSVPFKKVRFRQTNAHTFTKLNTVPHEGAVLLLTTHATILLEEVMIKKIQKLMQEQPQQNYNYGLFRKSRGVGRDLR